MKWRPGVGADAETEVPERNAVVIGVRLLVLPNAVRRKKFAFWTNMPLKFLTIPVVQSDPAEAELNQFLASHRVLSVERRFVDLGTNSFWALCVDHMPTTHGSTSHSSDKKPRIDYRESLSPDDFAVFVKLRDLRKQLAQSESVPVYTIFTNDQMAEMVRQKAKSLADLGKIAGVGEARLTKYGPPVLAILVASGGSHETSRIPL